MAQRKLERIKSVITGKEAGEESLPGSPRAAKRFAQAQPAYGADGVDVTLIRWMLSLTPLERLEVLQENIRSIMKLRGEN